MNISISIDEKLLNTLDDYRASFRPIPKLSEAIRTLILKGLKEEEITGILFEGKSLIYQRRKERKDRCYIQLSSQDLERLIDKGLDIEKSNKVDVIIGAFS